MATVSFTSALAQPTGEAALLEPSAAAPAQSQAPAVREERQLSTQRDQPEDLEGDIGMGDVRLPRINLVQKMSKDEMLEFGIGAFVFNKELKLSNGKDPVVVTALRFKKDYQQKLPYDAEEMGEVYNTPDEVVAAGGTLKYSKEALQEQTYYGPRGHVQFIVEAPANLGEEDLALFPYEFNGKSYGMAVMTVGSSAYTSLAVELITLSKNNKVMRGGLRFGKLHLTSENRKNGSNSWHVPVIKFAGANPPELVEFFESLG